jgi:hypothetical protein
MSLSPTQQPTRESRAQRARRTTPKALVWVLLTAIATFPFPWWW